MREILLVASLIVLCCVTAKPQKKNINRSPESTRVPYAIVLNEIDPEDKDRRQVVVLVKDLAFNRENLIRILWLIELRYPKPGGIQLDVYTDLEDIETPEERDGPHMTNHKNREVKTYKGNYAVFIRLARGKYGNCLMYFSDGRFQEVKIE